MKKQKVYIDIQEIYPIFTLVKKSPTVSEVEVDYFKLAKWKASIAAFKQTQAQMKKAIDPVPLDPPHAAHEKGKL